MKQWNNEIESEENRQLTIFGRLKQLNFDQLFLRFRYPVLIMLFGLILAGLGVFYFKRDINLGGTKVEVLNSSTVSQGSGEIIVEVAGSVEKPGVYKLSPGARVEDALISAGGISANADRTWMEKTLNRAAKLSDGQKILIPASPTGGSVVSQSGGVTAKNSGGDQTVSTDFSAQGSGLVNINTASLSQLDTLPGIGQVYAQKIIEHRPYSTLDELVSKGAVGKSLYEKIKDQITIY
jgi:competence protein ComEA